MGPDKRSKHSAGFKIKVFQFAKENGNIAAAKSNSDGENDTDFDDVAEDITEDEYADRFSCYPTMKKFIRSIYGNRPAIPQSFELSSPRREDDQEKHLYVKTGYCFQTESLIPRKFWGMDKQWTLTSNVSVCPRTVRGRLLEIGLRGCKVHPKPLLTEFQRKRRLTWAREHSLWTIKDWEKVIFSDESQFCISGNPSSAYVRRRTHE
ncbi:hypothetical protein TNCV_3435461 [Trichonephila clavipes]|nr:hypothetical protein TNCV_3435461 [Trichonephila clavipes]